MHAVVLHNILYRSIASLFLYLIIYSSLLDNKNKANLTMIMTVSSYKSYQILPLDT